MTDEQNALKPSTKALIYFLIGLPVVVLVIHGLAYLLKFPGAVFDGPFAPPLPVGGLFFLLFAGGIALVGIVLPSGVIRNSGPKSDARKIAAFLRISYIVGSVAWFLMIFAGMILNPDGTR